MTPAASFRNISQTVTEVDVLLSGPEPEPKTRADFLQYACDITIDPNTAHTRLSLSKGNRKVTVMQRKQPYPRHPDRLVSGSDKCCFGYNKQSWVLECLKQKYTFWFNFFTNSLPGPWTSRVGVYLDHRAGTLSFYSISKTMTLLHRAEAAFTKPLYAGLWLRYPSPGLNAEFCKLK
ncbi:tripartite motif-containing protein 16-like protein [Labrus mixtus]|uniref:tripartite motif-containing protein 16-like protein n=1 Tax=Labrus mixtus TaxID=508554 RepID=UPI0029C050AD|nr:tripartite motif-containing protein 16-like protein [Labrus mixtus]